MRQRIEINAKPDAHADAGGGEAVVPADFLAERAADQRRQKRADIDADIENGISAVAARIARRIKPANLGRDVRLKAAGAQDQRQQREQEKLLDRHHEMADRHQHRADHDGAALAEHAVGEQAAEDRREIDKPGIEPPDLRRQRLYVERAEDTFEPALEAEQPDDVAGMIGQQQVFGHIEHEQRAHAVIGKALPHLGGEQISQPARMAEQVALCGPQGRRLIRLSHDASLKPSWPGLSRPSTPLVYLGNKTWMPGTSMYSGRPTGRTRVAGHDEKRRPGCQP